MRKISLAIAFSFIGTLLIAQSPTTEFTDLATAQQNPEAVETLNLNEQGLTSFPEEILKFKNSDAPGAGG